MTALLVLAMFAGFVLVDLAVRRVRDHYAAQAARRQREAVLATSIRLDFSREAPSLKRVEVARAKARLLAVDDETVVLDSLRRVLVLAGYSVDTVESGAEALGLVRQRDYDFVFTDLKMPGMDGVEVVRAVRHLRPDIDVAVITGYGTIETAVDTVREGALDYVQKPFTEDELLAFVERLRIRREARLEAERRPAVRIVSPAFADTLPSQQYGIPGGFFVSAAHLWVRLDAEGRVRVGLDDFGRKAIGRVERLQLPTVGDALDRAGVIARLHRGLECLELRAPLAGKVVEVNDALSRHPSLLVESPYDRGWLCVLAPADVSRDLPALRIGRSAVEWYGAELDRLRAVGTSDWPSLAREFMAEHDEKLAPA
jgi:ActR/RegA family two-component response regulator/glycine cleavage system H lipoate-binding protein